MALLLKVFRNGSEEVPLVKDTIPQLTLTRYCRKQLLENKGESKGGQRPSLAHGLCLQSLVCYTLYLRVCEKSGTRILVAGFEADKKSFVSVPVSLQK